MSEIQDVAYKAVETPAEVAEAPHIQDQIIAAISKRMSDYSVKVTEILKTAQLGLGSFDAEYVKTFRELVGRCLEEHRNVEYQINSELERAAAKAAAEVK